MRRENDDPGADPYSIQTVNLFRRYGEGPESTLALGGVSFTIRKGEFVTISGPSGSGKSTLLNQIGALDRPTSGQIFIDGIDISKLSSRDLARIRNQKLGFVFQDFNLIPRMSTIENIELPLVIEGVEPKRRRERAMSLLESFGIASKARQSQSKLSGGQKQRVAVARALANDPSIVLADEPTGNLDSQNAKLTMDFLEKMSTDFGKTLVVITHDLEVAKTAERTIIMRDGMIERIEVN